MAREGEVPSRYGGTSDAENFAGSYLPWCNVRTGNVPRRGEQAREIHDERFAFFDEYPPAMGTLLPEKRPIQGDDEP